MATYVLIPGAGGVAWYWHLLEAELRERGHEVVAVDLPADDDSVGLSEYADAVVGAIGDRTNLVLVAQSFAGFTAPLVCERVSVDLLVMLNAMVPSPGEAPGDWWSNTGHGRARREQAERDGRDLAAGEDLWDTFFHDVPREVTAEAWARGEPRQSGTPFAQPWPLPKWPDVPTRFLQGRDDRFFPVEFQRRVVRERLGITPDEMAGGHLVALSRPKELADRLEAYRKGVAGGEDG
ncbi:MAG TPA: alpha/beta hydrolase [Candidatus Sulfotelmatobacter sp.]|nr:alpha/beta hydrolase [Candidatus Sulfotelmatobacter sp.]